MARGEQAAVSVFPFGMGFVLFVVLLVLRLTGVIGWSWWWVTVPVWGPLALAAFFAAVFLVIALGVSLIDRKGGS